MAKMTQQERLERIESYLREHKYADLHTLADSFGTSLSTVRRALNELESRGVIRRHHGGASLVQEESPANGGYDFITQDDRQVSEKLSIARTISAKIEEGMTVVLDGGTSTYAVARQILNKRLVVITNSLPIAALFGDIGTSETIVTGGTVYSRLGMLYGPTCELSLRQIHADIAILGGAGITQAGIWNNNSFIVSVQNQILRSTDHAYFALDHTKFGRRALHLTGGFAQNMTIVTDKEPAHAINTAMRQAGSQYLIA